MRRRRGPAWLFLVGALLVAGCASPWSASTEPAPGPDQLPDVLTLPNVVVTPGGRGGEPMLAVGPDGALYTYSTPPGESFETVYRSRDEGRTWTRVGPAPLEGISGDPDLTIDRDGTIWFVANVRLCNFVAVSRDAGDTWRTHQKLCLGASYDRPRIVPVGGGLAYLYHHNGAGSTSVLQTTDHGETWTPVPSVAAYAATHPTIQPGWGGGGFVNPVTGSVYFTYTVSRGPPSPLLGELTKAPGYGVFRDGGDSFEIETVPGIAWPNAGGQMIGGGLVEGVADRDGNVYLAWAEFVDGEVQIRFVASRDDGRTWSDPVQVDPPGGAAIYPALATGAGGELAIAYYANPATARPEAVPADSEWRVVLAWTRDAIAPSPVFEYGNLSGAPIKRGPLCNGGLIACDASGQGQGDERALLEYFDIQPLADGRIAAVWTSALVEDDIAVNVVGVTAAPVLAGTDA